MVQGRDNLKIIMIKIDIRTDKTIQEGHSMITITEVILGEEILEECQIIEVRILEVDIELTLDRITLEDVVVGLEEDSIQVVIEQMSKVVVGLDQV